MTLTPWTVMCRRRGRATGCRDGASHGWRRHRRLPLAAGLALWLGGCTATVFPPPDVQEPARVGVLDHGRHASLILEVPKRGMLRYAYGDWGWYALGRTGVVEGIGALLWPTEGALGRKRLPEPFSAAAIARGVHVPIARAVYLTVEAGAVDRLVARLERIFRENGERRTYNPSFDLVFVPHPEPYSILHNSNHVVRAWLEDLGCRVEGGGALADWRLGTG